MAQWSQGLPLGSTEHCFSFSKNSTSSETVASSTPNLSWLGCSINCGLRTAGCGLFSCRNGSPIACEKGASHGDCVGGTYEVLWETIVSRASGVGAPTLGVVVAGGVGLMKSIMRARDDVLGDATCEWLATGVCAGSPAIRRATRSAIKRA